MDSAIEDKMDVTRDSWVHGEKELDGMRGKDRHRRTKIAGQRGG